MSKQKDIVISLILDGKQFDATIQNSDQLVKKIKQSAQDTSDKFAKWGQITTGFNQAIELSEKIFNTFKTSVMGAAELGVLRSNFKGSADDINLFRKATANTVSEGNLIKLSNQATDLGINLKDQALLFSLAEDRADKYGGTVEENFTKLQNATEGGTKGLKDLGIQKEKYEEIVKDLAKAEGDTIDNLDAETQKRIKLEAIIKASGITMEDVTSKTQDQADKLSSLGIRIEEANLKMGAWIADGLEPVIDMLGQTTDGTAGFSDAVLAATTNIPALISMLGSLKMAGANLGWIAKFIAAPVALGVGAGMGIDYLHSKNSNLNGGWDFSSNDMELTDEQKSGLDYSGTKTDLSFLNNSRTYVDSTGKVVTEDIKKNPPPKKNPKKKGSGSGSGLQKPDVMPDDAFDIEAYIQEQTAALDEITMKKWEADELEKQRIAELFELKQEYFDADRERNNLAFFEEQTLKMTMNDLDANLFAETVSRDELLKKMQLAKTQSEFKNLQDEQKIASEKIKIIKAEKEAREQAAISMIQAGIDQYNAGESLAKQLNRLANQAIKRIIAEAVMTQIGKVIASIPFPFNLIAAPAAGLALEALLEAAIPSFATGVTNFEGGIARVGERGEELVQLPKGSNVIPHNETRQILSNLDAGGDGTRMIVNELRYLGDRLERVERTVRLDANSFDEAYTDYKTQKTYVA